MILMPLSRVAGKWGISVWGRTCVAQGATAEQDKRISSRTEKYTDVRPCTFLSVRKMKNFLYLLSPKLTNLIPTQERIPPRNQPGKENNGDTTGEDGKGHAKRGSNETRFEFT